MPMGVFTPQIPARIELVQCDPRILSSYDRRNSSFGGPRDYLMPLIATAGPNHDPSLMPMDVAVALYKLHKRVTKQGGDFRVTDARRDLAMQSAARGKYENWLAAGKPAKGSSAFDPATMKAAYVSEPGKSYHNAGRAIDVDIARLDFPDTPADKQLDRLWKPARKLGWRPIIKTAAEQESEAWHFDYLGDWAPVFKRLGAYNEVALMATLDIGVGISGGDERDHWRGVQAQLHRVGEDPGGIDGLPGSRTHGALKTVSVTGSQPDELLIQLFTLPTPGDPEV